jgi:hypothetical protein
MTTCIALHTMKQVGHAMPEVVVAWLYSDCVVHDKAWRKGTKQSVKSADQ